MTTPNYKIVKTSNQSLYLKTIKIGEHPQFVYDTKQNKVLCRCGADTAILRNAYVCSSFTIPNNCRYQRISEISLLEIEKELTQNEPDKVAFVSNQWLYLRTVKDGLHPQFTYNDVLGQVICRCGSQALIVGSIYVCPYVTGKNNCDGANTCEGSQIK